MPNLQEPDWKSLRIGDVQEFWQQHDAWEERVIWQARRDRSGICWYSRTRPRSRLFAPRLDQGGQALRKAERFDFALEQLERGLAVEPDNLSGLQEKGICLQRLALAGRPWLFAGSGSRALPQRTGTVSRQRRNVGAAGAARQGCLDRRVAPAGQYLGTNARRAAYEDALLRRPSIAMPAATGATPTIIIPASMR